jgi:hypothetical protein
MKPIVLFVIAVVAIATVAPAAYAGTSGRIYGKLTTVDGDVYEGLIRWDKNEASWVDILNGNKELKRSGRRKYHDREKTIKILGITIGHSRTYRYESGSAQSGLCFGHIKSLEVTDDDAVLLELKSGETVELEGGSTDIGEEIREIIIEDINEGEIEFEWDDVERIDFMQGSATLVSNFGERLYGMLKSRRGDEFTGWICWDVDELFTNDILDGNERNRKRKIEFGRIDAIERHSSNAARVYLKNGEDYVLRGTNDVDDDNRGISVYVEGLGQIKVGWDEFERVDFTAPPRQVTYDEFDGGHRLQGTVYTEDGETYTGTIRWDDDEEYSWEILDGEFRDIEFDVEFRHIREIKRRGYHSSIVTLWDGTGLRLKGTNDVAEDNKGIFIELANGDEVELEWDGFERVEFAEQ